ncbi:MAG: transposon-encoded TnpW family protein [Lachnospiraceae bacterium]|nr:transposon-encoded TnpW family protein [Lachnospiraceae bacterium]
MENKTEIITETKKEFPVIRKRIGNTTYLVWVHFAQTAGETMQEKIRRMLRDEVRYMPENG